ncbi:hypothetical protein I79_016210 [Cricetulus griseus]|uniref:Uncharacterized protein n=1 Tax=Cricetulus griseus TaxID=10029 RepID=G3HYR9_CRIGR|nr:hypothetical protein I79_016210 [Cricetulus griseus]
MAAQSHEVPLPWRGHRRVCTLTSQPLLAVLADLLLDQSLLFLQLTGTLFSKACNLQSGGAEG